MAIGNKGSALHEAYEDVAAEYYDPERHPTCANFREASHALLLPWFNRILTSTTEVLETGAGQSLVLEVLSEQRRTVGRLVVTDSSAEMLKYSDLLAAPLELAICDAQELPWRAASFDVVVSSLGDPYNTQRFWHEVGRVLRPGGYALFSTPSFTWSAKFREGAQIAEFLRSDGRMIAVPSFVASGREQRDMFENSGLILLEKHALTDTDLRLTRRSPKLRSGDIVTAYI